MKHLLFLSWWWPYPASNGSKLRVYNLLRHLSRTYKVTLLSFAEMEEATPEEVDHMRAFCPEIEIIPKPHFHPNTLKATLGYFSPWPRSLIDVYSPIMAAHVRALLRQMPPDVIVASELQTMRYLELAPNVPSIFEEVESTVFHDTVKAAKGRLGRFRAQLTVTKFDGALKRQLTRGVALTVVSEAEQAHIRRIAPPGAEIVVVPNGVDITTNRPNSSIQPQPHSLIYTGAVTYSANLDAVQYCVREVLPLIRARAPQTQFTITGSTGRVNVDDLKRQPGVIFSGYLPSVAGAVQASWAMIVPLRVGGGTRLKILEAMALGTPVISTSKGAEGLNVRHGENILIADTPQALADATTQLFADAALRTRLAQGGRALVERDYDWGIITARLSALIERITRKR
jgi:glycosyltransferase involved in cell wall biosynthesis